MTRARPLLLGLLLLSAGAHAQHSHAGHGAAPLTMQDMNAADLKVLRPLKGQAFDVKFAQLMINHHRMAVDMAQYALKNARDPRVKKNAQEVITVQNREIEQMKGWLNRWKASVPKASPATMTEVKGGADRWFLTEMIPHHQGAIDMAKLARTRSQNKAVLNMAAAILKTQQGEINQYQAWLKTVK